MTPIGGGHRGALRWEELLPACVTPGVTLHPLLCFLKQILVLPLPLTTSQPLGKSFYLRPVVSL